MSLHPLETRGWGDVRDYSIMVARKLLKYLDLRIKELEEKEKINDTTKHEKS